MNFAREVALAASLVLLALGITAAALAQDNIRGHGNGLPVHLRADAGTTISTADEVTKVLNTKGCPTRVSTGGVPAGHIDVTIGEHTTRIKNSSSHVTLAETVAAFALGICEWHPGGQFGISAVKARDAMNDYAESPTTKGIGIYINLSASAAALGDRLGQTLQKIFLKTNPPIPSEYRFHQSRGTGTMITFYVREVPYEYELSEVKENIPNIVARYREAWSLR